jgi:penicillin-binding protein A
VSLRRHDELRRRRLHRAWAVLALGTVGFLLGAIVGAGHHPAYARALASSFLSAWAKGEYAAMYADIDPTARSQISRSAFVEAYGQAQMTATITSRRVTGRPIQSGPGMVVVGVEIHTRLFGTLASAFRLPMDGQGEATKIAWSPSLVFPGMRPGELLSSQRSLPPRAALLARDGSILADGPALSAGERSSPLGSLASAVVGAVGPVPASRRRALESEGVPADAIVGVSGLERTFDSRLRGAAGGELLAGRRVLASVAPHPARAVRTTISPSLQSAAVRGLGAQFGGIVAIQPSTGQILAVAGIGLEALQPPGSTFKMVTVSSALQAGVATPRTVFPYQTSATLDGVTLSNANGESCGGTLDEAFAVSCNSVFAPLGVKIGAPRLVASAERFGFNHDPGIVGAAESTIPAAAQIQGELDLGSTAIGQGQVQASALEMATVAATIANGGRRPQPTFIAGAAGSSPVSVTRAIPPAVAREVRHMMIEVVQYGTGTSAAIPGVTVAAKTGTAELGNPSSCPKEPEGTPAAGESEAGSEEGPEEGSEKSSGARCRRGSSSNPEETDAWLAAFAPALAPRIVVAVLLVHDGFGGATAAPVARQVLEAGLQPPG